MPLTVETLRAAYDYLATTPPFSTWNLPDSEDLKFKVAKAPNFYGWHDCKGRGASRKHTIAISNRMVGHTGTLMVTVAHEALHLHQELTGQSSPGVEHNAAFRRDSETICRVHGFDQKAF